MRTLQVVLVGAVLLGASAPVFAADQSLRECTKTFSVGPSEPQGVVLSRRPSKICSMDCLATATNGWGAVIDSPDGLQTHAQAVYAVEKGAATAGDSTGTGAVARYTNFGLTLQTVNAVCTGSWVD